MTFAALLITGREWMLPVVGFLLVAGSLLLWTYSRAPADKGLRTACAFLKLLGLAALLACLLEPLWSGQRARPGANYFAIMADNSQGLGIKDDGASETRGATVTNLLMRPDAKWLAKMEENFQLRRYFFDTRLQSTRDFSELVFDGRSSSLGTALRSLSERFRGQPLAGVLLLTDGNATDLPDGKLDAAGLAPVYPIVIGRDDALNDIAIQKVAVSQTAFEDAPVTVQADVAVGGYRGRAITAQLMDSSGQVKQTLTQRAARDSDTFRFQLRPEQPGVSFYRLRVGLKDEPDPSATSDPSGEASLANNERVLLVDPGKGPYRILYVSGRPNWEFKFLNRALAADAHVEMVGLIRIARRERNFGRIEFRSRPGETANPLFRGFDRTTEDTAGYDQPVLVRLNTKDATELAGGFPKNADVLFKYHAVVVDDLEAEFFTRDQMSLLQRFVSERGGGFLMLGGAESFRQGQYEHTAIGEMLPVYLDAPREALAVAGLRLNLTREGWLQPWARLRDNETEEKRRLTEMPGLAVLNTVRDVKPGASVIAEVQDENGRKQPALVAQRFGNGRVGALLVGDLWRWGLRDEVTRKDQDKAWRQMIRWLIADVPNRVEVVAEAKRDDPNQAVSIQVRARDKEFRPLDNATVKLTVTPVLNGADAVQSTNAAEALTDTNSIHLNAESALAEAGLYEALYVPRVTGGYLAEAVVTDEEGIEVGRVQTGWTADPAAEEFRSLKPNRALLESIARQTSGEVLIASGLEGFAERLPNRKAPVTESWSFPLWHQPLVFLLALGCFVAEWGLRRWKGLA